MHKVSRLIFRYDYSANFDVFDGMGAVLKIVMSDENFWESYSLSDVKSIAPFLCTDENTQSPERQTLVTFSFKET